MTPPRILPVLVLPVLFLASAGCTSVSAPTPAPRPQTPPAAAAPHRPTGAPSPVDPLAGEPAPAITALAGGTAEPTPTEHPTPPAGDPTEDAAPPAARPRPRTETGPAHPPRSAHTGGGRTGRPARMPTDPCDALAAAGVFPAGGETHRWCRRQEGLR
ncbi:hypothetical protein [Embleya sp. NPDC059237]|uniref:hypothetical protein n=1 Tax=Embleya sp. NPDC059237 TaxID=3346784 RepID=UPI00367AB95F